MRSIFSLLALLVTLALVFLLVKKQLLIEPLSLPLPTSPQSTPAFNPRQTASSPTNTNPPSELLQQQYKQAIDAAIQVRPMPADSP
ncbi:hypothetical protein HC248_01693 [Polaromonas vacuolata]|uniref:Uncharacterized protein n=1 Tax=Polaromonas vacuolata TaxID=37448 RepID=A0A6H2H938_9BURK|nr:hypothetical protein HC248_01693 [Polaromonas vacuolata]